MTATLERGEWSAACPGHTLPPGKTRYPFYRRLGGPQGWSRWTENLVPTGIRFRPSSPILLLIRHVIYRSKSCTENGSHWWQYKILHSVACLWQQTWVRQRRCYLSPGTLHPTTLPRFVGCCCTFSLLTSLRDKNDKAIGLERVIIHVLH